MTIAIEVIVRVIDVVVIDGRPPKTCFRGRHKGTKFHENWKMGTERWELENGEMGSRRLQKTSPSLLTTTFIYIPQPVVVESTEGLNKVSYTTHLIGPMEEHWPILVTSQKIVLPSGVGHRP